MHGLWLEDIESLEAISQDHDTCELCLRIAEMSADGRLTPFLRELEHDRDLDDATKATISELASDTVFLHAVADYVEKTRDLH